MLATTVIMTMGPIESDPIFSFSLLLTKAIALRSFTKSNIPACPTLHSFNSQTFKAVNLFAKLTNLSFQLSHVLCLSFVFANYYWLFLRLLQLVLYQHLRA